MVGLTFRNVPDYESPSGANAGTLETRNTYTVIVTATDNGTAEDPDQTRATLPPLTVTVNVKNLDEPGGITLSTLQPLQGIPLTATLTDPDGIVDSNGETVFTGNQINDDLTAHASTTWQWARSSDGRSGWVDIVATTTANMEIDTRSRTPEADDVNHFLRITATYTDGFGSERTASVVSAERVRRNLENDSPAFVHAEGNEYTNDQGEIEDEPNVTAGEAIPTHPSN